MCRNCPMTLAGLRPRRECARVCVRDRVAAKVDGHEHELLPPVAIVTLRGAASVARLPDRSGAGKGVPRCLDELCFGENTDIIILSGYSHERLKEIRERYDAVKATLHKPAKKEAILRECYIKKNRKFRNLIKNKFR